MKSNKSLSLDKNHVTDHKGNDEKLSGILFQIKKYFASVCIIMLLIFQGYIFGVSDGLTLLVIIATMIFIWPMMSEILYNSRRTLSIYFRKESVVNEYIEKKNTILQIVVCGISSLALSILFIATTKGIILNHGYFPPLLILFIFNLVYYKFNAKLIASIRISLLEDNMNESIVRYGMTLLRIFIPAMVLNLILTLLFSAYDTYVFKTTDINFENFIRHTAEGNIIMANGHNQYSRIIINLYLFADNLKMAFAKYISEDMFHIDSFYFFLIVATFLNFIKLVFFSWAYIILFCGFDRFINGSSDKVERLLVKTVNVSNKYLEKIKSFKSKK